MKLPEFINVFINKILFKSYTKVTRIKTRANIKNDLFTRTRTIIINSDETIEFDENQPVVILINGDVTGNIDVFGSVTVEGNVGGTIDAGDSVIVKGNAKRCDAGDSITIEGNVEGNIEAGDGIKINGNVEGNVDAGDSIHINGSVTGKCDAGDSVIIKNKS